MCLIKEKEDVGRTDNTIAVVGIREGQHVMLCAKVKRETPTHQADQHPSH